MACYLGELNERETVAPGTIQNCLTPINAEEAMLSMDIPGVRPLLMGPSHDQ